MTYKGEPHYGVIRWIGTLPERGHPTCIFAGVEMEEENGDFTDGTYNDKLYFECNSKKGLFVPLSKCRKDSRFSEDVCQNRQNVPSKINCKKKKKKNHFGYKEISFYIFFLRIF